VLLLVFGLGLAAYAYTFEPKHYLGGDNVAYYLLGQALADGEGYVNAWRPEAPPANHFPPGYPALIAAMTVLGLGSTTALKLLNGLILFGSLLLLYGLFVRLSGGRRDLAAVAVLASALNTHLLFYGSTTMSEVPFLFTTTLVLAAAAALDLEKRPWADPWFWVMAAALAASYYLRSIGLAVFFGVLVFFLLRRRWLHGALTVALFVLAALPWYLRGRAVGGNSYVSQLLLKNPYDPDLGAVSAGDLVGRFFGNLLRYVSVEIPTAVVPALEARVRESPGPGGWVVGLLLVALVVVGLWRLRALRRLLAAYFVGTLAITLLWPEVWTGVRFILALVPLLVFLALYGLLGLLEQGRRGRPVSALWLVPFVLLLAWVPLTWLHASAAAPYPPQWRNYFTMAEWAREHTPPGAVIAARKEELFHLFAGRPTTRFLYTSDAAAVIEGLEAESVDYVVVDQLGFAQTGRFLVPAVEAHIDRFAVAAVVREPDTYLLHFLPAGYAPDTTGRGR
jgi:hypothetical protein